MQQKWAEQMIDFLDIWVSSVCIMVYKYFKYIYMSGYKFLTG